MSHLPEAFIIGAFTSIRQSPPVVFFFLSLRALLRLPVDGSDGAPGHRWQPMNAP